ncbi:MAG: NifU family protein [Candidatus Acidiferrales bacterium]
MHAQSEARKRVESIDQFMNRVETVADPDVQELLRQLVQSMMAFHSKAIERMLEITRGADQGGNQLIEEFGRDECVRNLLLLYGAHPMDLRTRVAEEIEKLRPNLRSHGGDVKLLEVNDSGNVTLRLIGNGEQHRLTAAKLRSAIEEAIYNGAPDVTLVSFEGAVSSRIAGD